MSPAEQPETVVLCVDGSEISTRAVAAGAAVLRPTARVVIVTVIDEVDLSLAAGSSGFAGGVMSAQELERFAKDDAAEAQAHAERAAAELKLPGAETHVLRGVPGRALCDYAREISARALVLGTRGRGGVKRALLGSVSDYVVRNAPCPVVVVGPEADD